MQRFFLERTRTVKERNEFEFDANSNWSEIPIFFSIWGMHRYSLIRIYLTMHFCAPSNSPSWFFNPRDCRLRVVNWNFHMTIKTLKFIHEFNRKCHKTKCPYTNWLVVAWNCSSNECCLPSILSYEKIHCQAILYVILIIFELIYELLIFWAGVL